MRTGLVAAVGLAAVVAACSESKPPMLSYHIRVAAAGQQVTLKGCSRCPLIIKPQAAVEFIETRRLPRTYTVIVGGHATECAPARDLGLQPSPTTPMFV